MNLLVDISAHGLGHLAQAAPVMNALRVMSPGIQFTVRSDIPYEQLKRRIMADFKHVHEASDFGFVMNNAVDIDLAASADRYRELHSNWSRRVSDEAAWLKQEGFNAVLTNVSYLPLAGAAQAGIPAFCACSLNWADLFAHYFGTEPWAAEIHAQMLAAYNDARRFFRVTPGVPMDRLENKRDVAPIARVGTRDRARVARSLGVGEHERWVLVAMGGMPFRLPLENWRPRAGIRWIVPAAWNVTRHDVSVFDLRRLDFVDLLASVDAVVTKPGYGTFVEAACSGVPILYLERADWPETPHFAAWLAVHARAKELPRSRLLAGDFIDALEALCDKPEPTRPQADGAEQVAAGLLAELGLNE